MIKFTYRHITKLIELIDYEIDRVESAKSKSMSEEKFTIGSNTEAINASRSTGKEIDTFTPYSYAPQKFKYDKELEVLNKIKEAFQSELDKLEFTFNIGRDTESFNLNKENK